jgi:hypothetical protein
MLLLLLLLLLDAALLATYHTWCLHKRNVCACAFLIKVGPTRVKSTHAQSTVYSSFICKEIRGIISRSNANATIPTAPYAAEPRNTAPCRYTNPRKRREIYRYPAKLNFLPSMS